MEVSASETEPSAAPRSIVAPVLGLATLAAALLRLPFLGTQSLWFDETYTVHVVGAGSPGELWDRIGASESTPPLSYALTWAWSSLIGDSGAATVRTIAAVALIAAVPATYAALRRLIGRRPSLAAAGIVAFSPVLVHYSLDARAYGLLVLLSVLSIWAFSALLERPTGRRWALWALAAAATIWTHWFGGFLVLGEAVALLWLRPAERRQALLACGAVLVALAPLVPLLLEQTGDERAGFIAGVGIPERIEMLVRQFALGPNVPRTALEALGLALALGGAAAGTALAARLALGSPVDEAEVDATRTDAAPSACGARGLLAVVLVALLVPLLLAATGVYDRFNLRNVLFLVPLAAGLAGIALVRLRAVPLAAYLVLCTVVVVWVHVDWRFQNTDWRGALRDGNADVRLPVVAVTELGDPVAELYLHRPLATGPISTRRALLLVEPRRAPGRRDLAPVEQLGAPEAALLNAFAQRSERRHHGFRLIELTSPEPVPIDPAALPAAAVLPARPGARLTTPVP